MADLPADLDLRIQGPGLTWWLEASARLGRIPSRSDFGPEDLTARALPHVILAEIAPNAETARYRLVGTNYVAFTSGAEAVSAGLGGHVAAGISGVGEFLPHIKSGRLRAIAVSSAQRLPDVNIPTLRELGVDIELVNWRGIFAGPGITEAQRDHLAKAVEAAVKTPSWKQSLDKLEWLEFYQPGKDFGPFIESEQKRVALIIESLGLGRK